MTAVLLPYGVDGDIDWPAFEAHVNRTVEAGLTVGVNMDTGYVQLLADKDLQRVLEIAGEQCSNGFVAGAYVADEPGATFDLDRYLHAAADISAHGGTPVVFPSYGLNALDDEGWVAALESFGREVDRFIGFELGPMFVPYGRIPGLDAYWAMLDIASCIGAKHSSLNREAEWARLALRAEVRPDFKVFTGNDRAIDMVMWGSDYLLGLSTFAPAEFARRDAYWAAGDPRFFELNDALQYLGNFTFRHPVPAYRHDAAMFLQLRGWADSDNTPPGAPRRPESDRAVLADILKTLEQL
ncbi:MAG: dihydrodipicolinate synthase family protein [Mycobacterium sp.]